MHLIHIPHLEMQQAPFSALTEGHWLVACQLATSLTIRSYPCSEFLKKDRPVNCHSTTQRCISLRLQRYKYKCTNHDLWWPGKGVILWFCWHIPSMLCTTPTKIFKFMLCQCGHFPLMSWDSKICWLKGWKIMTSQTASLRPLWASPLARMRGWWVSIWAIWWAQIWEFGD